MSDAHTRRSDIANGSPASSPSRGRALRRQVLKLSEISAVPTCRRLAAPRTGAYFRSHRRDHPMIAVPLDRKNPRARPGSPIHVFSHTRLSARRPIKPTSTESEADPVKWIFSIKMAQHKALVLLQLNSHAKMVPDTGLERQGSGLCPAQFLPFEPPNLRRTHRLPRRQESCKLGL
jgi:hypothetical protein